MGYGLVYLAEIATDVAPGFSAEQGSSISTAFTNAGGNITTQFVQFLPVLLGLAVAGFALGMAYKAVKKVRKGGR